MFHQYQSVMKNPTRCGIDVGKTFFFLAPTNFYRFQLRMIDFFLFLFYAAVDLNLFLVDGTLLDSITNIALYSRNFKII